MTEKRLVVITGASSGIGEAIARRFSEAGYSLLLLARRINNLQSLKLPNAICKQVDVTQRDEFASALAEAEELYGPADCLVNNAGIMLLNEIHSQDPNEWKKMFDVNVLALLTGTQLVLNGMKSRKTGTIFNISSVAGRKTFPNHVGYCGTKFAVHAISENLREEVANDNVRVIVIAPGAVETELLSHTTSEEIKSNYNNWKTEIGGVISPDDIARSVLFAYQQPQNVCMREILIASTKQAT